MVLMLNLHSHTQAMGSRHWHCTDSSGCGHCAGLHNMLPGQEKHIRSVHRSNKPETSTKEVALIYKRLVNAVACSCAACTHYCIVIVVTNLSLRSYIVISVLLNQMCYSSS